VQTWHIELMCGRYYRRSDKQRITEAFKLGKLPEGFVLPDWDYNIRMTMEAKVLNIGDLAKPATALIEKVSDAIGGLCAPWQIKRVAHAQAEVNKILAVAQLDVDDIQRRGFVRLIGEQGRIQGNIEAITGKAIEDLSENAKPEELDTDWVAHFFDKCKLVSNPDMQNVWPKFWQEKRIIQAHFQNEQ
jgi:hypothetical protein